MKKIFISILLVSTFVLINFDVIWAGPTLHVFREPDEAWYAIVAKNLETNDCSGIPVTFLYQDRPNFHSCELLKVITRLTPGKNMITKVTVLKVSTRAITLMLLALLGFVFFESALLGYLLGLVYFVDDGVAFLKPIFLPLKNLTTGHLDSFTRASRLISPMQYAPILFAFTFFMVIWLRAIAQSPTLSRRQHLIFATTVIVFASMIPFTPFYAWICHLYFTGACLFYLTLRFDRKLVLPWIVWSFAFISCIALSVSKIQIPFRQETLVRSGFFDEQFAPLFIFDKSLLLFLTAFIIVFWKSIRWWTVAFALGLFALVNINVITGREYQNLHFRDYYGILLFLLLVWGAWIRFANFRLFILGTLLVSFVAGSIQYLKSQIDKPAQIAADLNTPDLPELILFFQQRGPAKVVCGQFYEILPLVTEISCSWHHLLMTYPLSNQELLEFTEAHFRLQGYSSEQARSRLFLDALPNRSLGVWSFGVKNEWIEDVSQVDMYGTPNLLNKIIPLWIEDYKLYDVAKAKKLLSTAQYLILDNNLTDEMNEAVILVKKFSVYGVYRWKE